MPRLIDAEHLKKRATDWEGDCWDNYAQSTEDFLEYIDNEPTVDAVEVVRCKDCKWWETDEVFKCVAYDAFWVANPDDYCPWGERKEDAETN